MKYKLHSSALIWFDLEAISIHHVPVAISFDVLTHNSLNDKLNYIRIYTRESVNT